MAQTEVERAWDQLVGKRNDEGLAPVVPLAVPNRVWLTTDRSGICWSAGTSRVATLAAAPQADLLIRFARLHLLADDAAIDEVVSLVTAFGPLGLCRHGLPAGHLPPSVIPVVRQDLDDLAPKDADPEDDPGEGHGKDDADDPLWWQWQACSRDRSWLPPGSRDGREGSEQIADWIRSSKETAALLVAGAATRRVREEAAHKASAAASGAPSPPKVRFPTLNDLLPLDRLLPADLDLVAFWTDVTDPDGHRRLIHETGLDPDPIGPRPEDPREADRYDQRIEDAVAYRVRVANGVREQVEVVGRELERIASVALQRWLDEGDLRVRLVTDEATGEVRMRWGNGGLFSVIAMQMAMTFGGIHALAVCDACRRTYRPAPWPKPSEHFYCEVCREDPKAYAALRKRISRQAGGPS